MNPAAESDNLKRKVKSRKSISRASWNLKKNFCFCCQEISLFPGIISSYEKRSKKDCYAVRRPELPGVRRKGGYMDISAWNNYLIQYGAIAVYVIVMLEYMNLPGFPAGVIMPLAGIWASKGEINFFAALGLSVLGGLTGSLILYAIGRFGGSVLLEKYLEKHPKQKEVFDRALEKIRKHGCAGLFTAKLIPVIRTVISIPAGVIRMELIRYIVFSALGITIWNLVFVGAGYLFGETVFQYLG